MIRVVLPYHLRTLAQISGEVQLDVDGLARSARSSTLWRPATRCSAARSATTSRTTPAVFAILRLRAGLVARIAGRPAARRGRIGTEPFLVDGGDRRRIGVADTPSKRGGPAQNFIRMPRRPEGTRACGCGKSARTALRRSEIVSDLSRVPNGIRSDSSNRSSSVPTWLSSNSRGPHSLSIARRMSSSNRLTLTALLGTPSVEIIDAPAWGAVTIPATGTGRDSRGHSA